MCNFVQFTDYAGRCISCDYRPDSVTCTWRRYSGWECSAQLPHGYNLRNAKVRCGDVSRCDGSTCTVDYSVFRSIDYSVNYSHDPLFGAVFALLFVFLICIVVIKYATPYRNVYWFGSPFYERTTRPSFSSSTRADGPSFEGEERRRRSRTRADGPSF